MLPSYSAGSHYSRRSPNLVISIPGTPQQTPFRPHFKPSSRLFLRYFPWVVGCTIVLWLFVLRGDNPPLRLHPPAKGEGYGGRPYRPPPTNRPPPSSQKNGQTKAKDLTVWDRRAEKVKDAFVHAFEGYQKHANGYDELLPVVGGNTNNLNGWGVTLFDSLDTMWIMGLHDTFRESVGTVAKTNFHLEVNDYAPFFETVIRYLGGLLSAYALSGEPILLTRADDLGRMLLPAYNTPSGLPMFSVNTISGKTRPRSSGVLLAEALSNQMEYKYLAHLTGRREYYNKTEHIMQKMYNTSKDGLFSTEWDLDTGIPLNKHHSVGAWADSGYEYLLKQWLLTSRTDTHALELYINSTNAIISNLLHITPNRHLLYVTDTHASIPSHKLEHLSCFLPGLIALGVHTLPESALNKKDREQHLWAAQGLAETCWAIYADTNTGLGADEVAMSHWPKRRKGFKKENVRDPALDVDADVEDVDGKWLSHVKKWEREGRKGTGPPGTHEVVKELDPTKRDWSPVKDAYLLRPETIETFYILWRTTGDVKWRERGWSIFEAIEKHCRTKFGYAGIMQVDLVPPRWKEEMPSYFLAETLKYVYLLFTDDDLVPLKHWVFNTEAHPLPIFEWTSWEMEAYDIRHDTPSSSS